MKLVLIGIITNVSPVQEKGDFKVQNVRMEVDNFDPNSGEKVSSEIYEFAIFNKKIIELNAGLHNGKKVRAVCWTKSVGRDSNGTKFYNIVLNCSALDLI